MYILLINASNTYNAYNKLLNKQLLNLLYYYTLLNLNELILIKSLIYIIKLFRSEIFLF